MVYRYELFTKKGSSSGGSHTPLWWPRRLDLQGAVDATVDPWLTQLGDVPNSAIDLVRLATTALLADRLSKRDAGWTRTIELRATVLQPDKWKDALMTLASLLHFLSGDDWKLELVRESSNPPRKASKVNVVERIALFSGGLDSFASAAVNLGSSSDSTKFLSHRDGNNLVTASQKRASDWLHEARPDFDDFAVSVGQMQAVRERSSRTRALLFVALGVAAATARGAGNVAIPENGFTSINPPLTPNRGGTLSTRSTHPRTLWLINQLLESLGIDVTVQNPHEWQTKGEIIASAASMTPGFSEGVATTLSCSKLDARFCKANPTWNCGLCIACMVRRGAILGAGLKDETEYVATHASAFGRAEVARRRRDDIGAMLYALEVGPSEDAIISTGAFPPSFDFDLAMDLWARALEELKLLDLP